MAVVGKKDGNHETDLWQRKLQLVTGCTQVTDSNRCHMAYGIVTIVATELKLRELKIQELKS